MSDIPDFDESELKVIHDTLQERYRKPMETQLGDSEIRLSPADRELTECPVVFWQAPAHEGAGSEQVGFVIAKTAHSRYRCQFFYRVHEQFGTGIGEYDNIAECVVTLLQVQADHEAKEKEKDSVK